MVDAANQAGEQTGSAHLVRFRLNCALRDSIHMTPLAILGATLAFRVHQITVLASTSTLMNTFAGSLATGCIVLFTEQVRRHTTES